MRTKYKFKKIIGNPETYVILDKNKNPMFLSLNDKSLYLQVLTRNNDYCEIKTIYICSVPNNCFKNKKERKFYFNKIIEIISESNI